MNKYTGYSEVNDNEGEEWVVFLSPEDGAKLEKYLEINADNVDPDAYGVLMTGYSQKEVDILLSHSDEGYYPEYQMAKLNPDFDHLSIDKDFEQVDNKLYKLKPFILGE